MSTVRAIINKAFREAGIVEVGEAPDGDEFEEGLELLQDLYSTFFGNELGEQLQSLNYGKGGLSNSYALDNDESSCVDSVYVPFNARVILNLEDDTTLYLHPKPMDGTRLGIIDNRDNVATYNVTIDGNGRQIEDAASVTLSTNGINREWFYRDDLAAWCRITDLVAEDPSPLPREFDILMTTALAIRLNPRYGAETGQATIDLLGRAKKQFRARYRQSKGSSSPDGIIRLPSRSGYATAYTSKNIFDRG